MQPCPWPIEALLPHAHPMILIDRMLAYDGEGATAEVTIRGTSPFHQADGVPGYVGIEYMAQAIAAFAGIRGRLRGETPKVGFLLGTRAMTAKRGWFRDGERLLIVIKAVFEEGPMGAFDGRIEIDGETILHGRLNVYQPTDTIGDIQLGISAPSKP